jgi:hypothetical protein
MKIKVQYETEAYISEGGYFCIKQDVWGEDHLVMLSRDQCRLLAAELAKAAKNKDWWQDAIDTAEAN